MFAHALSVGLFGLLMCTLSNGQLLNPSFENADPDRATRWFTPPLHWHWQDTPSNLNYVGLHSQFTPNPEQRQPVNWTIPAPVEGTYFALLSTGDAEGVGSSLKTQYSRMEQRLTLCPGDALSGYYFFGSCDYMPYDDTATIMIVPSDPNEWPSDPNDWPRPVTLVKISTADVGDYKSTDSWQHFYHRFKGSQCFTYTLVCEVRDELDKIFKSYLAVDHLRLCHNVPKYGDFNADCSIDYLDFEILAKTWLTDCSDPNVLADPNIPCRQIMRDPNIIDGFVEIDHLTRLSDHWLERFD